MEEVDRSLHEARKMVTAAMHEIKDETMLEEELIGFPFHVVCSL